MKLIRLETYQPSAHFRKPTSFDVKESFIFPPYSTVIGAIHAMCGFKEYVPMKVSIQGNYESINFDISTQYNFKPNTKFQGATFNDDGSVKEKERHQISYKCSDGIRYGINKGVTNVETVFGLTLVIHILIEDELRTDEVYYNIKNPKVMTVLGRGEDLLLIKNVSLVDVIEEEREVELENMAYVPVVYVEDIEYPTVRLNKTYKIINNRRFWDKIIISMIVPKKSVLEAHSLFDEDGLPVFLA